MRSPTNDELFLIVQEMRGHALLVASDYTERCRFVLGDKVSGITELKGVHLYQSVLTALKLRAQNAEFLACDTLWAWDIDDYYIRSFHDSSRPNPGATPVPEKLKGKLETFRQELWHIVAETGAASWRQEPTDYIATPSTEGEIDRLCTLMGSGVGAVKSDCDRRLALSGAIPVEVGEHLQRLVEDFRFELKASVEDWLDRPGPDWQKTKSGRILLPSSARKKIGELSIQIDSVGRHLSQVLSNKPGKGLSP